MSNLANKLPDKTRARLLSNPGLHRRNDDDLPPHLVKDIQLKLKPDENEDPDFDFKTPLYYACLLAMFIFVFFTMY